MQEQICKAVAMKACRLRLILSGFCLAVSATAQAQGLRFTASVRTTNGLSLQWTNAVAGQAYTLQSREKVTNSLWLPLDASQPWPTIQTQWDETLSPGQAMRLYRVVAVQPAMRGKLLSSNLLQSYTTSFLNSLFAAYGIPVTARFPVSAYKLVYETIDPLGGEHRLPADNSCPRA